MKITLVRGLPGSGKSTLAEKIKGTALHFEADNFFMKHGRYLFDINLRSTAHAFCIHEVFTAMDQGKDVIVSNTFVTLAEMRPYLEYARFKGYDVEVINCRSSYGNIHSVPDEAIREMQEKWEEYPGATDYFGSSLS